MAVLWVNESEEWEIMEVKKLKEFRRRLSDERDHLVKSISRSRNAESEIRAVKTEDEGDLATISQEKDILSCLNESVFTRLRFIEEGLNALDRGDYGECSRCGENIGEKRLTAVPWARTCIQCQEATEAERISSRSTPVGMETTDRE
jgi:DnaK suppressor protein